MTFNSKTKLRSTAENTISPERKLWCALLRDTFYRATLGEGTSLLFFKTQGGHFTRLCEFLQLPEADIRKKVIAKAFQTLNLNRNRSNNNGN